MSQECLCCAEERNPDNLTVCEKGHAVCNGCQGNLGRQDCVYCLPHQTIAVLPTVEESDRERPTHLTVTQVPLPTHPTRTGAKRFCVECALFLRCPLTYIGGFLALVYLGKVYIAFWFWCNPEMDHDWFAWDRLRYCLGEAFVGLIGTSILAGCCVSSRS